MKTAILIESVRLLGTSLSLEKGQKISVSFATNQPDYIEKGLVFARPLDGKWADGIDRSDTDSILIGKEDYNLVNPFIEQTLSQYDLSDLSPDEFNKIVFAGATVLEMRSPSDAFSLDEMEMIMGSDAYEYWPNHDKDFLWNAYAVQSGLDDRK